MAERVPGSPLCPLCRGPMPADDKTLRERLAEALSIPFDPSVVLTAEFTKRVNASHGVLTK